MEQQEALSFSEIRSSLISSYLQSSLRGLIYGANWAIELANSIEPEEDTPTTSQEAPSLTHSPGFASECATYYMGKSLYDLREFKRAAHALKSCESDEAFFLRNYCLYLAGEKEKEDNMVDALGPHEVATMENTELHGLRKELAQRHVDKKLDGYGYYLYGVVLKKLSNEEGAREMLLHSLSLTPMLWSSWQELAKLCKDRQMLYSLQLPNHWLRDFFYAAASLELQLTQDALTYYNNLCLVGFSASSYISSQLAMVQFHLKDYPGAAATFDAVRSADPYKITHMDTYSDVLFVMDRLPELSRLAQDVVAIDRYNSVSCLVLGNFYSLRGDHVTAVAYFQRAARLDKDNHSAWILLGHEYMEQRNCNMAVEAYSRGLETNKHDFRGYYGLGHTYELLRMPFFAIQYYKQAHKLRPSDPGILYALGTCYAELNQNREAKKCLMRAIALKDQEGTALVKLARLHAKLGEEEETAKLYKRFIAQVESSESGVHQPKEEGHAHLFLAHYYMKKGCYKETEAHAHKSTEFPGTRDEGKSLLREVAKKKSTQDPNTGELGSFSDIELSPIAAPIT